MAANIYDTGGRAAASNGVSPVSRTASSAIRNIWTIGRRGLGMTFTSLGTKLGRRPHGTPPDFHTASQSCFIFTVSGWGLAGRSEEHTSELQSLMRISYAVFCLKKKRQ